jgi:Rieske 2Fe-2S family protein
VEVDSAIYTAPERLAREQAALFDTLPFIAAHTSQLPEKGSFLTHDHGDRPLLLVRGRDGEVRTFINACRHRGVRLVDGETEGRRTTFTCPYHNWTYGLEGELRHVPLPESFKDLDTSCRGLKAMKTEERHGLVWVWPDPAGGPDLDHALGGLGADFDAENLADYVLFRQTAREVAANWKLIIDAFTDGYHVIRLHKDTVGPFFKDSVAVTERTGDNIRSLVARNELDELAGLAPEKWSARRHATLTHILFPAAVTVFHPDYISLLQLFPKAVDRTLALHTVLVPHEPRDDEERAHFQRGFEIIDEGVFTAEDFMICERAQKGMTTGLPESLLLGGHEKGVAIFHEILDERLAGH